MRLLIWLALFLTSTAAAQVDNSESGLSSGEPFQLESEQRVSTLIGILGESFCFSIENEIGDISAVGIINNDGSESKYVPLDPMKPEYVGLFIMGGKLGVFQTIYSSLRAELKMSFYDADLNKTSEKILASHELKSTRNSGHFRLAQSPSGNYVSILQESPLPKEEPEALSVYVLNNSGDIVWEKVHETSYPKKFRPTNSMIVSDGGDVHIIKRVRHQSHYDFHKYSFYENGNTVKDKNLELHGANIADLSFATDTADNLVIAGFLTTSSYLRHEGYFIKRYDNKGTETTDVRKSLPFELMEHFIGKKAGKSDAALENVYVEQIQIIDSDIYLYMEYLTTESSKDRDEVFHHHNTNGPMAVMRVDSMGEYQSFFGFDMLQDSWDETYFFTSFKVFDIGTPVVFYNSFESDKSRNVDGVMRWKFMEEVDRDFMTLSSGEEKTYNIGRSLIKGGEDNSIYLLKTDVSRKTIVPVILSW